MTLTYLGLIALLVPIALVGVLFALYRLGEMTRVSRATRWAIAGTALVASIALAIWDVANGGSVWTQLVTAAVWLSLIFMMRLQVVDPSR
ncbi:MAG: hypothetical protein NDJ92_00225 [Thermoanaerobaculia bacterium]|nr:hypothetical protein [Thermoanaerobaculia bacterium]